MTDLRVDLLVKWSKPEKRMTVRGLQMVSEARPTRELWRAWHTRQNEMAKAGIAIKKVGYRWIAYRYTPLPPS